MSFTAQDLKHRVELQRFTEVINSYGEREHYWEMYAEPYARITPISGKEFIAAQQVQAEVTTRITIRYRADVRAADRIVYGTRTFDILAVMDLATGHRELQLQCKELNP